MKSSAVAAKQLLSRRAYAFALQAAAQALLSGTHQRIIHCLKTRAFQAVQLGTNVSVSYSASKKHACYQGLQTCGSVWLCPVCSDRIAQGRREELMTVLQHYENKYYPYLITATISHQVEHSLSTVYQGLRSAWTALRKSASFQRFQQKTGYRHDITALETPYSQVNGWHPHLHAIALFDHELSESEAFEVSDYLKNRWVALTEKQGFPASYERGLTFLPRSDHVAEYVAKFGYLPHGWHLEDEVTRSHVKIGRANASYTPFQLLDAYFFGEQDWAGEKFREYALFMKGKRQLRYSKGFSAEIERDGIRLAADESLADSLEGKDYYWLLALEPKEWRRLKEFNLRGLFLDYIEQVAGDGDLCLQWLREQGIKLG